MIEFKADVAQAELAIMRLRGAIHGEVYMAWKNSANQAVQFMRQRGYKDRSGTLSKSMRSTVVDRGSLNLQAIVEATAPYAFFVDQGTKPHIIKAHGTALSFQWSNVGGQAFFRSVHHPGTKPANFARDVATVYSVVFAAATQAAIDRAVSK